MDPISIGFSCLTLIGIVNKASKRINNFIQVYCDAEEDLAGINRELLELGRVLQLLKNELRNENGSSDTIQKLEEIVLPIIDECTAVAKKINKVLDKYEGTMGALKWATYGKSEVQGLQAKLQERRGTLNAMLVSMSYAITQTIKEDTTAIRVDVALLVEKMYGRSGSPMPTRRLDEAGTVPPMPRVRDDPDVDSVGAIFNQKELEYTPLSNPCRGRAPKFNIGISADEKRGTSRTTKALRIGNQPSLMDDLESAEWCTQKPELHIPRRSDSESPSPYRNRGIDPPLSSGGEWDFILSRVSSQKVNSGADAMPARPVATSQPAQETPDTRTPGLPYYTGSRKFPQTSPSQFQYKMELASSFELESKPEAGAVSTDKSVAAVLEKDYIYLFDIRSMKSELIGHLDLRTRFHVALRDKEQRQSTDESPRLVQFLTTDGSLIMITYCDWRREIYHTMTQKLIKSYGSGRRMMTDYTALDENNARLLVLEQPANADVLADLSLIEISNAAMCPDVHSYVFKERVIYKGMDYNTPFKFSHGGLSVVILPTTRHRRRLLYRPIILRLDEDVIRERRGTFQSFDWPKEGHTLQSFAATDDTFVVVTTTAGGETFIISWDFHSRALRSSQKVRFNGNVFVTQDCQFLWSAEVDQTSQSWRGTVYELSTLRPIDLFWSDRNIYFQGGCTLMSRDLWSSTLTPQRVEIHNIVQDFSIRRYG